ncbi:hypothetical protein [Haloferula rosea]|uniref:SLA1 homology domain-containing protein n=1 Tax=Haloferula rosea TaxID=490093 RepID=A0A934RAR3_9BACT|nr:hypothetical protein [Haloferula rosea]MBK1828254.1 hypothetical protein [Haloferula rosea]
MKPWNVLLTLIIGAAPLHADDPVFVEKKGIVAMEAESTTSNLRRWIKKTDVKDFSGECHIEFTGNKAESGPPDSPLKYAFKINKGGVYQLTIRGHKRLETKRQDISNDCFVALDGDFDEAGGAPLKILRTDTKMFGGSADGWGWTTQLDVNHKKYPALYQLKSGETYELTISGRSKNFNIDRILFVHEDKNLREVQRDNPDESARESGGITTSRLKPKTFRTLTNAEGREIKAELVSKLDDTLIIRVQGKRFEIAISSLSEDDQKFIKDWQP